MNEYFRTYGVNLPHLGRLDLFIRGYMERDGVAELFVNGHRIGSTHSKAGRFLFKVADTFEAFERGLTLTIQVDGITIPHINGTNSWVVEEPFVAPDGPRLDVVAAAKSGLILTKKGRFRPFFDVSLFDDMMTYYTEVGRVFTKISGYQLGVTHGTLLGLWRDGALIPGDDDIDCFYVSKWSDIERVLDERNRLYLALTGIFDDVELGPTGHLKVTDQKTSVEIDIMPSWLDNGVLHISSYGSIPDGSDLVSSWHTLLAGAHTVSTFADPERFLSFRYGPSWHTPDPGYRYPPKTDVERRNLGALRPRRPGSKGSQDMVAFMAVLTHTLDDAGVAWTFWGRSAQVISSGAVAIQAGGQEPGTDMDIAVIPRDESPLEIMGLLRRAGFFIKRLRGTPAQGIVFQAALPTLGPPDTVVTVTVMAVTSEGVRYASYHEGRGFIVEAEMPDVVRVDIPHLDLSLPLPGHALTTGLTRQREEVSDAVGCGDYWTPPAGAQPAAVGKFSGETAVLMFRSGLISSVVFRVWRRFAIFARRAFRSLRRRVRRFIRGFRGVFDSKNVDTRDI